MTRRRGSQSIVANPVLVGAVTLLVTVVAVFLSYNANKGLPFVPTRSLNVQLENGAAVVPGNEVREGGYRIGLVEEMRPVPLRGGGTGAELSLKLDKESGAVPVDSVVTVRLRSNLGLKFLELRKGKSDRTFGNGDTLPAEQTRIPVELDEFENMFDRPTRRAIQENLRGFGDALTFRGPSLNRTIENLPFFLANLEPVMRTLADEETNIQRFFKELGDAARIVSPIAPTYARQFTMAANTFEAWSRDPEALAETIRRNPPSLSAGIRSFPVQRPFLVDLAAFSRSMKRATDQLDYALPRITPALRVGIGVLPRMPEVNAELKEVFREAERLFEDPATPIALRGLTDLAATLNPTLRFLGPYVTVCNYFNYAFTNLGEHITEPDPTGTSQRTLLNQAPRQDNSPGSIGATQPANGQNVISGTPAFLHNQPYPAAIDNKGNPDCEGGQRGYPRRLATYASPEFQIATDPRTPGNQGSTFTGIGNRNINDVFPGQTFSRNPQLGPRFPSELDKP